MKKPNKQRTYYLMLVPILVLFFCFNTLPLLRGFFYSFTNFRGFGDYEMVGLRNYIDLFQDARVGRSYLFTFKLALVSTLAVNVISLAMALALNSKIKFKSALRGMYFIPNILGALVVGYIFNYFFTYIVPVLTNTTSILADAKWAWVAIVVVCAWQSIAMNTIIYISGLQTVPEDVYEAGSLDGATGWNKFRYLTFPLIMP
ncbi:MAG: sugar ABC transporter permease, partial [Atopobiaceae bacterium]|nr:sugar ABC transporter permease [Atopobiaceae bacterium]